MNSVDNNKSKITIGALIPAIHHYYQRDLLESLSKIAKLKNCNMQVFCGQPIKPLSDDYNDNKLFFTLPDASKIDGLIIASGTISSYTEPKSFLSLEEEYDDIPLVSISYEIKGIYNIQIDNKGIFEEITSHLIDHHGFDDIAFISGAVKGAEAEARKQGYYDALRKHNIVIDENKVMQGDFFNISGRNVAKHIIENFKKLPQAVVCANDEMAFGLCAVFKENGIKIPDDVSVTGFDNTVYSLIHSPSITTGSQPLEEIVETAINMIVASMENKEHEKNIILGSKLILRESCGCEVFDNGIKKLQSYQKLISDYGFKQSDDIRDAFLINKDAIIDVMIKALGLKNNKELNYLKKINLLFDKLTKDFEDQNPPILFSKMVEELYIGSYNETDVDEDWKSLVLTVKSILHALFPQEKYKTYILYFALQSMFALDETIKKMYQKELFGFHNKFNEGSVFIDRLNSITSYDELIKIIKTNAQIFDFKQWYLCLLPKPVPMDNNILLSKNRKAIMVFGKNQKHIYEGIKFNTSSLLPDQVFEDGYGENLAIHSLISGKMYYGYYVCCIKAANSPVSSTFHQQVGNALDRLRMLAELEQNTKDIEKISIQDTLTGLYNRRGFYELGQAYFNSAVLKKKTVLLLFGDMDSLKKINDTYGHNFGDIALQSAARCVKKALREDDIISRIGGDEFAVILKSEDNEENVKLIIDRINLSLDQFNKVSDLMFKVNMSFGYSIYRYGDKKNLNRLLNEADKRLYAAKAKKQVGR